jgi:hypothetical protein
MFVILHDPPEDYQDNRVKEHQDPYGEYHPLGGIAHPCYMGKFMGQSALELFPVEHFDQP